MMHTTRVAMHINARIIENFHDFLCDNEKCAFGEFSVFYKNWTIKNFLWFGTFTLT